MKSKGFIILSLALILLICPLSVFKDGKTVESEKGESAEIQKEMKEESILVFSSSDKKVNKIDLYEYVVGSVAAEIPPTYHTEAIKAQAVASYTYALKARGRGKKDAIGGAHISDESCAYQGYIDKHERKKRWGKKYDDYEDKIENAVKAVFGQRMTYNGELITAAFHAISAGSTFCAKEIWGDDVPYLQSVNSAGDRLSPDFLKSTVYTEKQMKDALKKLEGVKIHGSAENWIGEIKKSESGYVSSAQICGVSIDGKTLRDALNLRSASFEIKYEGESFKVTTEGYGHGVGMSQYGADYMARQGSSYEEILKHYYKDVEIEK